MNADTELVEIDAIVIEGNDTEKAWLVQTAEDHEIWIPKSLSVWDGHTLEVARWFAEREGLV